jgi:signal transduction histidine kinase
MALQTESRTSADLLRIVNETVTEADALRKRLVKYERTLLSTRMIMGHELRRPATAIKGYLDLALENKEEMSNSTIDVIEKARDECRLLDGLCSLFLHLLRVDGTLSPVKHETADINACVKSIIEQLPAGLDAAARVTVNISPDAGFFGTNADAINVILANLVENALIYSGPRSQVRVSIERADDKRGTGDADLLKIVVDDEGKGIPDAFIQKIFRPFVRLQDDITDGSGLGLTLVRSLVELYGGSVFIRSEENNGTAVHVTIPETAKAEEPSVLI